MDGRTKCVTFSIFKDENKTIFINLMMKIKHVLYFKNFLKLSPKILGSAIDAL